MNTYRMFLYSKARSPISHMMGVSGNEALIAREKIYIDSGVVEVPFLSGNALRHKMIREPGMKYLIGRYNLMKKLNIDQLNFMLAGGSLYESSVTDNLKIVSDMQRIFPLFKALGGSLRNQIVSGSMNISRGVLLCEENREIINQSLPEKYEKINFPIQRAESFVGNYQYTRGDARRDKDFDYFEAVDELNKPSNLMMYNGQTLVSNSVFLHDIILMNVSILEVGAIYDALCRWQRFGGVIGGQSRIGHGRLKTLIDISPEVDLEDARTKYLQHVDNVKEEAIIWLNETFKDRPSKGKKK